MAVRHYGMKHMIPEAKVPGLLKNEASRFVRLKKHHNKIFLSTQTSGLTPYKRTKLILL